MRFSLPVKTPQLRLSPRHICHAVCDVSTNGGLAVTKSDRGRIEKNAQTSTRRVEKLHTEKKAEKNDFSDFSSSFCRVFLREQCHHHIAIIISIILGWFSLISLSLVYLCHTEKKKEIWSTLRSVFAIKFFNWAASSYFFSRVLCCDSAGWLGVLCESALESSPHFHAILSPCDASDFYFYALYGALTVTTVASPLCFSSSSAVTHKREQFFFSSEKISFQSIKS